MNFLRFLNPFYFCVICFLLKPFRLCCLPSVTHKSYDSLLLPSLLARSKQSNKFIPTMTVRLQVASPVAGHCQNMKYSTDRQSKLNQAFVLDILLILTIKPVEKGAFLNILCNHF